MPVSRWLWQFKFFASALDFKLNMLQVLLILSSRGGDETSQSIVKEGEKIKLIQDGYDENSSSDSLAHVSSSSQSISRTEELKTGVKDDIHHGKNEAVLVSIGLSVGRALPLKLLGSYPESI
ncbi:hypothetical protein FF1_002381 [Malus domestica]